MKRNFQQPLVTLLWQAAVLMLIGLFVMGTVLMRPHSVWAAPAHQDAGPNEATESVEAQEAPEPAEAAEAVEAQEAPESPEAAEAPESPEGSEAGESSGDSSSP